MAHTFGEELKRFALSIDSVDNEISRDFYDLLVDYLERVLKINYFQFMIDSGKFEGNPLLQVPEVGGTGVFWSSDHIHDSVLTRSNGEQSTYVAQSTSVYGTGKPIWVTAHARGTPLNDSEQYEDAWSGSDTLPNYYSSEKGDVRTSIVIPLKTRQRTFGFMCLESTEELKFTDMARSELERVAEAAGMVLSVRDMCKEHHQNTNAALRELKDLSREHWPSLLHHPKIFLASADDAENDVMEAIREIAKEFPSKLRVVHWKRNKVAGDIMEAIRKDIVECRFGICYFSERAVAPTNEQNPYCDNPNVLFEAGMLQALTGSPAGQPTAWIPIRESNSAPEQPPFDFQHQNILFVKRLDDGDLDTSRFKKELRARITSITGIQASNQG